MDNEGKNDAGGKGLLFDLHEWPPWLISVAVACQHLVMCFGVLITMTFTVAEVSCAPINDSIRARLFCSSLFMVGVSTAVNTAIGIRMPVFQGPSSLFLFPILVLQRSGIWECPSLSENTTYSILNSTDESTVDIETLKFNRINELSGSLMLAAMAEVLLGATGLIGLLLRFLGPIPIAVTITLLGISLYPIPVIMCDVYWPVALVCSLLMVMFAMYLAPVRVTFPRACQPSSKTKLQYPIFEGFSVILSMGISWILSAILTSYGVFTDDPNELQYRARTDTRTDIISTTPWFLIPYPGQFGFPGFNTALFIGFLTAFIASAIESVGDYFGLSRVCNAYPPPPHAVNRGILTEGVMSVISGSLGVGHATTSYTPNIVIVELSKVGSRYVLVLTGIICMVLGVIGKLGAVMTSIPEPVIGGLALVAIGVMVAIGMSGLQRVNLTSSRNMSVIGTSLFAGIVSSEWLNRHRGEIDTGSEQLDQVIEVVLGTPMLIGGVCAAILDNTVKGNRKDRGFDDEMMEVEIARDDVDLIESSANAVHKIEKTMYNRQQVFDIPYVKKLQRKFRVFRYLPFLQPYRDISQ